MALSPRTARLLKIGTGILGAYVLSSFVVLTLGSIDYSRVANDREPLFAFDRAGVADGGSVKYRGPGYVLYSTHRFSTTSRPAGAYEDGWAYDVGPAIYYPIKTVWPWGRLLMQDREELKLVTREEDEAYRAARSQGTQPARSTDAAGDSEGREE